jgi:hypothetical protein
MSVVFCACHHQVLPRTETRAPARVVDHRGARRHGGAAHAGGRRVLRRLGARPSVLSDGLCRRLVADGAGPAALARALRLRPQRASRSGVSAGGGHRAAAQSRLEGQGAERSGPPRRFSRAPGRPLDSLLRAHQRPRDRRTGRCDRMAADAQAARLQTRHDARRLSVRERNVPPWRTGTTGRDRRLGDGHSGRSEAGPGMDGAEPAREHRRARALRDELCGHARNAFAQR